MSLRANVSIVLHLHNFRNLALPHKARYALQVHLFQEGRDRAAVNLAMPFNLLETEGKRRRNVSREGAIEDRFFRSKCFNIEYEDEEIDLNDACEFKLTLEAFPELDDRRLYLEFVLVENSQCYFREDMEEPVLFKEAERHRFRLENLESGVVQYHEGEFSQAYLSSFAFSLFLMITDYRFHPFLPNADTPRERSRQKAASLTDLFAWAEKYLKWEPQQFYARYVKTLRYNSVLLRGEFAGFVRGGGEAVRLEVPREDAEGGVAAVSDKEFFEYVTNYRPEAVSEQLMKAEIYRINQDNFLFFQTLARHVAKANIDTKALRQRFRTERRDLFAERLIRTVVFGPQTSQKEQTGRLAGKLKKHKKISELKIVDEDLFVCRENQHYAVLEVNLPHALRTREYEEAPSEQVLRELSELRRAEHRERPPYDERNMVVFFCHGFQASSYDMEMLRRELRKMLPTALLHPSTANETDTEGDIAAMGARLAEQVKAVVARNFEDPREAILNFVGHSMGGVIARACVARLPQFQGQLGFFFSLSTPHLGYLNGVDAKIKAGLWFMRKMNKVTCLDQLALEDAGDPRESLLFRLSQAGHLRDFQKVILLSSSEDSYVGWHSARACYPDDRNANSRLEREMVDALLGDRIVHRIDVHFDIDATKDIDSFIGRAAHIHLLTHHSLLKLINEAVPSLFDLREL